ncbi:MAG: 3 beta-hydroxysteroid dehydrogenase/Delta 5--_4-isomerase [Candidatus Hydrogenedentes bacterium ADurb.Bin101]|jgi:uncharacterized protein YbjT (DUF2867 family)|nr:MAG: 3 beta-hydroxysteroid dehydrogenase/Delta 5-->4-isomerase [Candidatus Hydrogenedentes bacterium ADurb.Bin101]HOC67744.1 SDR family oxidoreductase [Candidatus Hydrogenedentota bacterium]
MSTPEPKIVLIAGATGYVGGRLLRVLEEKGVPVRCLARRPEVLQTRVGPQTEVIKGDLAFPETLPAAFDGVSCAYYLVHSLGNRDDFESEEERTAQHFATAARNAGVRRILYLGGLCDENAPPSAHMRSRLRVGEILRGSGLETIEFRASIIIGSGSLSFELIRALVHRLPVMVTPRWVNVKAQPIAIQDVLAYLTVALDLEPGPNRIYEIGGAERMSYLDLMREYGQIAGLRRFFIPVPVLTPWLSSLWLGLVTPVFSSIGRKLIESITTPSVVHNTKALSDFPFKPQGVKDAIILALRQEDRQFAETRWTDALSSVKNIQWGGVVFGNRIVDARRIHVDTAPENTFAAIQRIGGKNGWYYGNWLWRLRGLLDWAIGGVGMHRGRRDPEQLRLGDVIDCWRVEEIDAPRLLRLFAEMRLPGRAWLQFEVTPEETGSQIVQTALYDPVGVLGLLYWYALYPIHQCVFAGMLKGVARKAREISGY